MVKAVGRPVINATNYTRNAGLFSRADVDAVDAGRVSLLLSRNP